jgi:Na+/proline symporter
MRFLTIIVAMIFSVPYLGVQLKASGLMFHRLLEGTVLQNTFIGGEAGGAILLSVVVFIYVASGGLRSVAYVDCAQCILLALGIVILGLIALNLTGGWAQFTQGLATLAQTHPDMVSIPTRPESSSFLERHGVLFFDNAGGPWTGLMILTYMFALMGIQSAPAFSMWAFANKDPRPFPWQQVVASSLVIGGILFFFTAIQGLGGAMLDMEIIPGTEKLGVPKPDLLVPYLISTLGDKFPWLLGLLAVCALAAMQSTGAAYMSTASGIVTRDLYRHFFNEEASNQTQVLVGRISVAVIVSLALLVGLASGDFLVLLGGLAVAFGLQMWPALLGICYIRFFTPIGVTLGLIAGLLAVMFTYSRELSIVILSYGAIFNFSNPVSSIVYGVNLPLLNAISELVRPFKIGRYPLTLHSAGWGIFFNLGITVVVSAFTQPKDAEERQHRNRFHDFLAEYTQLSEAKRKWKKPAWILTIVWFLCAIGPFAVLGNETDPGKWSFGIPSLWVWQIVWWIIGVIMMYLLAFKLEMSTVPEKEVANPSQGD